MTARPNSVRLRTYRVGAGDCLLLTVAYGSALPDGRRQRHMLVDCGTAELARGGPSLAEVAAAVAEHCAGRLDAVVATHRHVDHVSGFGDAAARRILEPLSPGVVIRPWTDTPVRDDLDAPSREFVSLLDGVHTQAEAVPRFAFDGPREARRAGQLATLAVDDPEAASLLDEWARRGRSEYVTAGSTVGLDGELPGVTVEVLGPPGGDGVDALLGPARHSAEPWLQLAATGTLAPLLEQPPAGAWDDALRELADPGGAGAAEWLLRALNTRGLAQGLEIAEAFDDVVHDTSAVLLVTVGSRSLLLPGDAQAGGWSATLDRAWGVGGHKDTRLARRLADVDVYKVGRHGARAGTPRRLADLWRPRMGSGHPLVSVLTTEPGVFGQGVPDDGLVADLAELGPVHRSDELPKGVWWMDVEAPARGKEPVAFAAGPPVTT
jgi:hypothetical protein